MHFPLHLLDEYEIDIFRLERKLSIVQAETNAVIAEIFGG